VPLQTMPDKGEWTVRVDRWTWIYTFYKNGTVTWKDAFSRGSGHGTWKAEKGKIVTRWQFSETREEWDVPLNSRAATGKANMAPGIYDLKAEANNLIDPDEKSAFLERCNVAVNKIQSAQFKFNAWLSGISVAYGDAYDAHSKLVNDIAALQKLFDDMLLEAALRFLTGGVGGMVGGAMKRAALSDFMVDSIKDLTKYGLRGPTQNALKITVKIKGMPASPHKWQNLVNERVSSELGVVSDMVLKWRLAAAPEITTFNPNFDPADVVEKALTIKTNVGTLSLLALKEVDKEALQTAFEKGFLVKWIELGAVSNVPMSRDIARDRIHAYGLNLGLTNIDDLLDQYIPAIRPMFPAGSLTL
jgi:hypothetical protein